MKKLEQKALNDLASIYNLPSLDKDYFLSKIKTLDVLSMGSDAFDFQTRAIKLEVGEVFDNIDVINIINEFDDKVSKIASKSIEYIRNHHNISDNKLGELKKLIEDMFLVKNILLNDKNIGSMKLSTYYSFVLDNKNIQYICDYLGNYDIYIVMYDMIESIMGYISKYITDFERQITQIYNDLEYVYKYHELHMDKIKIIEPLNISNYINDFDNVGDFAVYMPYIYELQKNKQELINDFSYFVKQIITEGDMAKKICLEYSKIPPNKVSEIINFLENYFVNEYGWIDMHDTFTSDMNNDLRRIYVQYKICSILGVDELPNGIKFGLLRFMKFLDNQSTKYIKKILEITSEYENVINDIKKINNNTFFEELGISSSIN